MSSQAELHVLWKIADTLKELTGLIRETNQKFDEFNKAAKVERLPDYVQPIEGYAAGMEAPKTLGEAFRTPYKKEGE